jgi:hypothetical protein
VPLADSEFDWPVDASETESAVDVPGLASGPFAIPGLDGFEGDAADGAAGFACFVKPGLHLAGDGVAYMLTRRGERGEHVARKGKVEDGLEMDVTEVVERLRGGERIVGGEDERRTRSAA